MATVTLNSTYQAGIRKAASAYSTVAAGGGTAAGYINAVIGQAYFTTPSYQNNQGFVEFDTSTIVGTPLAATLSFVPVTDQSDTDFEIQARLFDFGASPITAADYRSPAQAAALPLLATLQTAGLVVGSRASFTSVNLLANLNLAGKTRIVLVSDRYVSGTSPTGIEAVLGDDNVNRLPQLLVQTNAPGDSSGNMLMFM